MPIESARGVAQSVAYGHKSIEKVAVTLRNDFVEHGFQELAAHGFPLK